MKLQESNQPAGGSKHKGQRDVEGNCYKTSAVVELCH